MSDARVRTSIIGVVVFALFSALFARLWYLQVAAADQFHAAATSNAIREIREPAIRGRHPRRQRERARRQPRRERHHRGPQDQRCRQAACPGDALDAARRPRREARGEPQRSPDLAVHPGPGRHRRAFDKLAWVAEHKEELPGVRAEAVPVRRYPNGVFASHLLGYVGEINADELKTQQPKGAYELGDTIGKSGVELSYESDLRGRAGVRRVEVDATGRVIRTLSSTPPVPGHDVRLTLDVGVQKSAESRARAGARVGPPRQGHELQAGLQDPGRAGGIRRRAGRDDGLGRGDGVEPELRPQCVRPRHPGVDLAGLADKASKFPLVDRAVVWSVRTRIDVQARDCDRRTYVGRPHGRPYDQRSRKVRVSHGPEAVLQRRQRAANGASTSAARSRCRATCTSIPSAESCTTAGSTVSRVATRSRSRRAQLGSALTGISLPERGLGRVPDPRGSRRSTTANPTAFPYPDWLPGDNILNAIGQNGVLVTPIQLANAYATLANGGTRFSPRLADEVFNARGTRSASCRRSRSVTWTIPDRDVLMAGFTGVVENPKGTAYGSFTGFPRGSPRARPERHRSQGSKPRRWFVGMTPAATRSTSCSPWSKRVATARRPRRRSCALSWSSSTACRSVRSSTSRRRRGTDRWPGSIIVSDRRARFHASPLRHVDPLLFGAPLRSPGSGC